MELKEFWDQGMATSLRPFFEQLAQRALALRQAECNWAKRILEEGNGKEPPAELAALENSFAEISQIVLALATEAGLEAPQLTSEEICNLFP